MELSQIFSFLVLGICATHVVWMAGTRITSWWDVRKNRRSPDTATTKPRQRNDWYVFFSCSDLVGPDPVKKTTGADKEKSTRTPQKPQRPQLRPSAY